MRPQEHAVRDMRSEGHQYVSYDPRAHMRLRHDHGASCADPGLVSCVTALAHTQISRLLLLQYKNNCLVVAAGVNMLTEGPCADAEANTCTFPGGDECGDGQYCAVEAGKCAARSM